jgi:hypothetical protein
MGAAESGALLDKKASAARKGRKEKNKKERNAREFLQPRSLCRLQFPQQVLEELSRQHLFRLLRQAVNPPCRQPPLPLSLRNDALRRLRRKLRRRQTEEEVHRERLLVLSGGLEGAERKVAKGEGGAVVGGDGGGEKNGGDVGGGSGRVGEDGIGSTEEGVEVGKGPRSGELVGDGRAGKGKGKKEKQSVQIRRERKANERRGETYSFLAFSSCLNSDFTSGSSVSVFSSTI